MTLNQVEWASTHDWFICSTWNKNDSNLLGRDEYTVVVRDEFPGEPNRKFDSYIALKEWAGY